MAKRRSSQGRRRPRRTRASAAAAPRSPRDIARADLTDPVVLGRILSRHGIWLDRRRGQNLLVARDILDGIITAAALHPDDRVLEVGAGAGVLTRELAAHVARVIAVEIDARLIHVLQETCTASNLCIVHGDIMRLDIGAAVGAAPYRVVANLPFNVATALISRLLHEAHPPRDLLVMVQREVAGRLAARPGTMSLLSVQTQLYADVEVVLPVPRESFFPPPQVDAAMVRLVPRPTPRVPLLPTAARFWQIVEAGFANRRKQLHNALGPLGVGTERIRAALVAAGVDPVRRAETLSLEEWSALSAALWAPSCH